MKPGRDTNSEPGLLVAKGAQRRRASRNGCFRGRLKSRKTTNSFMFCNTKHVTAEWLACVASVSVQFGSKKRVTRVHVRVKNGASKRAGRGGEERKETLAGQTPGVWKLPTWHVMPECAHRDLMLSSAVISWHIKCLTFRGAEVNFRGRNKVFILEETHGPREWRNLNESERSMQALKLHTEFDLQSWSYFVKLLRFSQTCEL